MKKNIAIVSGGDSGEKEISLQSALEIQKNIDINKFCPYTIFISKKKWICKTANEKEIPVDKNDFSVLIDSKKIIFDCVFLIIHGTPGEDGKLQGYFDLLEIPYTSCNRTTSAITFNKSFCKGLVNSFGVLTAKSVHLFKHDSINPEKIFSQISLPCFVKPNSGGSSVGMTKVVEKKKLKNAITTAFAEDNEVLVEEFISGREITCGILKSKGKMIVLPLTEIVSKKDFFDFEAKYDPALVDEIVPAVVTEKIETECKTLSSYLYNKLNCKGIVRFDYILSNDKLFFLEVNTIPGLSENSIVPKMAKVFGLNYKELITLLIEDALENN